MKTKINLFYLSYVLFALLFVVGCSVDQDASADASITSESGDVSSTTDDASVSSTTKSGDASSGGSGGSSGGSGGSGQTQPGVITAGRWRDADNWDFWKNLLATSEYKDMDEYWSFYPTNRISVLVESKEGTPIADATLSLRKNETVVWTARTDNSGTAELWIDLYTKDSQASISEYKLVVNDVVVLQNLKLSEDGVNKAVLDNAPSVSNIDIAFVVDATGSMGDELEYLKTELQDVLDKININNQNDIRTSSVFYRDEGDSYVTRLSPFSTPSTTISFIGKQSAAGGGDFPEAVHSALNDAIEKLAWEDKARARLMFFLLDAPPHYKTQVVQSIQADIEKAAAMGIRVIPIVASGIDKKTEFLMRFWALTTDATYVFITDDSGVGGSHLEPTIGKYDVEKLNEMLIEIINSYLE